MGRHRSALGRSCTTVHEGPEAHPTNAPPVNRLAASARDRRSPPPCLGANRMITPTFGSPRRIASSPLLEPPRGPDRTQERRTLGRRQSAARRGPRRERVLGSMALVGGVPGLIRGAPRAPSTPKPASGRSRRVGAFSDLEKPRQSPGAFTPPRGPQSRGRPPRGAAPRRGAPRAG